MIERKDIKKKRKDNNYTDNKKDISYKKINKESINKKKNNLNLKKIERYKERNKTKEEIIMFLK